MKKSLLFISFILFVFLIQFVSASYISGDIYISKTGEVSFDAQSDIDIGVLGINFNNNVLNGETEYLTMKENGVWTFYLNGSNYNNILLDIHLPKELESIKSVDSEIDNVIYIDNHIIILIDKNKNLDFSVKYELRKINDNSFIYFWLFFCLIFLVIAYLIFIFLNRGKKKLKEFFPYINDNEKKILECLMKSEMRQKELRKKLELPKASFSRYIFNLEKKRLIVREGEGKNKIIRLK
ncbi:MAG: winged helix-turn-helix transcriptional regulator [Candidatus Pacearchaeota archaeon]